MKPETSLQTTDQNTALVPADVSAGALQSALAGDLSRMPEPERLKFYGALCQFTGLNPLSKPFDWLNFQGKLVLYANKGCAEQLRKIHNVSVEVVERKVEFGCLIVRVKASLGNRCDESIAAVPFNEKVGGEIAANAMMKCETKAKRRVTLSICGLSMLVNREDEEELHGSTKVTDIVTGTETVEDKANRLNDALTKGEKDTATTVEAEVVPEVKREPVQPVASIPVTEPVTKPVEKVVTPELVVAQPVAEPEWTEEAPSNLLTQEEVAKLQAVLMELPDQKKGVSYLIHRGWLPVGKDLEHTSRREFTLITTKIPAFKRMVEGWKEGGK